MSQPPLATYIYALLCPDTGAVRYVGKTVKDPHKRLGLHLTAARIREGNTHRLCWLRKLLSEGKAPRIQVLETVSGNAWVEREQWWIAEMRRRGERLTNRTDGGEGNLGWVPSEETRARISAANRGKPRRQSAIESQRAKMLGRPKTPEHVKNQAAAARGKKRSPETCAKIAARPRTPEERAKNRASHLGKRASLEARAKMSAAQLKRNAALRGIKITAAEHPVLPGLNSP